MEGFFIFLLFHTSLPNIIILLLIIIFAIQPPLLMIYEAERISLTFLSNINYKVAETAQKKSIFWLNKVNAFQIREEDKLRKYIVMQHLICLFEKNISLEGHICFSLSRLLHLKCLDMKRKTASTSVQKWSLEIFNFILFFWFSPLFAVMAKDKLHFKVVLHLFWRIHRLPANPFLCPSIISHSTLTPCRPMY